MEFDYWQDLVHEYFLTLTFTALAVLDMLLTANNFSGALIFILWNGGTAFLNEWWLNYYLQGGANRARYMKFKTLICILQIVYAVVGLWVFYRFLN